MVIKSKAVKSTNKTPNIPSLLKKVATVSDSTKSLSREIKTMSKIFAENQKLLVSMKNMVDTLSTAIEHVQKQEKKIASRHFQSKSAYLYFLYAVIQTG